MKNCRYLFSLITLMFIFTFTGCGATVTQISDSKTIETGDALTLEPSEFFEASKPDTLSEIQFDTTAVDTNTAGTYEVTATYKKDAYTITVQVNEREDTITDADRGTASGEAVETETTSSNEEATNNEIETTNSTEAEVSYNEENVWEEMNKDHPELKMTGNVNLLGDRKLETEDDEDTVSDEIREGTKVFDISDNWIGAVNDATNGWTNDGTDKAFQKLALRLYSSGVKPEDGDSVYEKLQYFMQYAKESGNNSLSEWLDPNSKKETPKTSTTTTTTTGSTETTTQTPAGNEGTTETTTVPSNSGGSTEVSQGTGGENLGDNPSDWGLTEEDHPKTAKDLEEGQREIPPDVNIFAP